MSATATKFELREFLAAFTSRVCDSFIGDLNHIPEDKFLVSPMGVARTPAEFTAECAGFNKMLAAMLRGEKVERPDPEAIKAFYATIDSREKAINLLRTNTDILVAAIREVDEAKFYEVAMAPWGQPMALYDLVHKAGVHMCYHDGQANYVQALYGDGENHWG